jgi:hypothetical protein
VQLAHPAADLDGQEPQRAELHPANSGPDQPSSDVVGKPVGRRVQEQPELVGKEAVAAEAICLQRPFEVLYPPLAPPRLTYQSYSFVGSSERLVTTKRVLVPFSKTSAL